MRTAVTAIYVKKRHTRTIERFTGGILLRMSWRKFTLVTPQGTLRLKRGEWIVKDETGLIFGMSSRDFKNTYTVDPR